jgi:peptidylprolyl isomerase
MEVSRGDTVKIEYVARDSDDELFDTSNRTLAQTEGIFDEDSKYRALALEVGGEGMLPGVQEALVGLEEGERARVVVPPEQAYGEPREQLVGEYDREAFEQRIGDLELEEGLEVGSEDGNTGRVVEFDDETVTVDFNPELAGETLTFDIEVVEIIETTSEDEERASEESGDNLVGGADGLFDG